MLSVIVPVYNMEKYLTKCIDSILQQSYCDIEVILIDDGSTDSSGTICDKFAKVDNRVVVIHQINKGLPLSRYVGINIACGDYITFVDGDDWFEKGYLKELMHVFDVCDIDISIGAFVESREDVNKIAIVNKVKERLFYRNEALKHLLCYDIFSWTVWGKIYKAEILINLDSWWYIDGLAEDLEFTWKVFQKARCVYYTDILGYYHRYREDSMSNLHSLSGYNVLFGRFKHIVEESQFIEKNLFRCALESALRHLLPMFVDGVIKRWLPLNIAFNHQTYFISWSNSLIDHSVINNMYEYYLFNKSIMEIQDKYDYVKLENEIRIFVEKNKYVYIYGAGRIGQKLALFLDERKIRYDGFVVSSIETVSKDNIFCIDDLIKTGLDDAGFIVALGKKNECVVEKKLSMMGIKDFISVGRYFFGYLPLSQQVIIDEV